MNNIKTAVDKADEMILKILETQPELLKSSTVTPTSGKAAGDFIAALRDRLEAMYQPKS